MKNELKPVMNLKADQKRRGMNTSGEKGYGF